MTIERGRVLASNPGSTTTKFGVFTRNGAEWVSAVRHRDEELEQFRGHSSLAQLEFRAAQIRRPLEAAGYRADEFAAVAGRGAMVTALVEAHDA